MERSKMILAQPLYLWRNGGNIKGYAWGVLHTRYPLLSLCQPSRVFRAPAPLNAGAKIGNEHGQHDQPKREGIKNGELGHNDYRAKRRVGLIRKARRSLSSSYNHSKLLLELSQANRLDCSPLASRQMQTRKEGQ
jgi:hypothetical protein